MENNLKWMGHTATIFEMQRKILKEGAYYDVKLVFHNGEYLFAHKVILSSYSDFFKECLKNIPETLDQETVIIIPDIKRSIMQKILDFVYIGEVTLNSSDLTEFLESNTFLGIKNSISFECAFQNNPTTHASETRIEEVIEISQSIENQNMETEQINSESEEQQKEHQNSSKEMHEQCKNNSSVHMKVNIESEIDPSPQNQFSTIEEFEQVAESTEAEGEYIISDNVENYTKSYTLKEEKLSSGLIKIEVSSIPVVTAVNENPSDETTIYKITEDENVEAEGTSSVSQAEYKIYNIETETNSPNTSKTQYIGHKVYTEREHNITMAIKDVLEESLSLSKAASKYNISKTVLWRRIKNDPMYKHSRHNPMLSLARERLEKGETLKSISQSLKIPMSTLHRHKVRLLEQGFLPDTVTQVKRRLEEDKINLKYKLEQAIKACQMGMSQNKAAQDFGISKSTLWRHFKRIEASQLLSDQPNDIKKYDALEYSTIEYTITDQDVDQEIVEEEQEYSISEFEDDENKFRSIMS
ncbi:uncharacterized protein LOC129607453 [Condylostylus longicornis]|uniref:uncharacterized protein LOC129607453 n=1 Tax=Condylostylus longicornis TaxID=2530218 RepID=UPI00244DE1FC|nr:uncharacterized protein LOC129607453 [Condylostylus longicornis]XP_055374457.1 uncharacterized protein LOC129607453 [Condylostylus longicornis]